MICPAAQLKKNTKVNWVKNVKEAIQAYFDVEVSKIE